MNQSQFDSVTNKNRDMPLFVPIPKNRSNLAAQLSAPVRDLADLLAQMAAVEIMKSLTTRAELSAGETNNE